MILFDLCDSSPFVLGAEAVKWIETVELPVNTPSTMPLFSVYLHSVLLQMVPTSHFSFCIEVTQD